MARWQQALAGVAAVAVAGGLGYGVYLTVTGVLATAAPTASASASSSPQPSASSDPCAWSTLPEDQRPALAEPAEGLPVAYAMSAAVWDCTGNDWTVEVSRVEAEEGWPLGGTAQAIYLRSPSGDLVHLYDLRTDVQVEVVAFDVPARVAWTARLTEGDSTQVVQMDLADGKVSEDWGGGAIPATQRHNGGVWDVRPVRELESGAELWLGYDYLGNATAAFARVEGREFRTFAAQRLLDQMVGNGSVNSAGEPGVTLWVSSDLTYAAGLEQVPVEPGAVETTGSGTWVVMGFDTDLWRLTSSTVPPAVCAPAPEVGVTGTYDAPGSLTALCATGDGGAQQLWTLLVDGEAALAE